MKKISLSFCLLYGRGLAATWRNMRRGLTAGMMLWYDIKNGGDENGRVDPGGGKPASGTWG